MDKDARGGQPFRRRERPTGDVALSEVLSPKELLILALVMQPGVHFTLYGHWQAPQVMASLSEAEFDYFMRVMEAVGPQLARLKKERLAALLLQRIMLTVDNCDPRFLKYIRPKAV